MSSYTAQPDTTIDPVDVFIAAGRDILEMIGIDALPLPISVHLGAVCGDPEPPSVHIRYAELVRWQHALASSDYRVSETQIGHLTWDAVTHTGKPFTIVAIYDGSPL